MLRQLRSLLRDIEYRTNGFFKPAITVLIAINVLLFLGDAVLEAAVGYRPIATALAMKWELLLQGQIWRVVTAGFVHGDFFHLLFNLLFFGGFAHIVHERLGQRRFVTMILTAIIIGNLGEVSIDAAMDETPWILGFSGAFMATIVAFATIAPHAQVIFIIVPMPAWLLASLLVLMDIAGVLGGGGGIANLAHLGGAAVGFLAIRRPSILRWGDSPAKIRSRFEQWQQDRGERLDADEEAHLDELLQKVSDEGLASLTPTERAFLARYTDKKRQR